MTEHDLTVLTEGFNRWFLGNGAAVRLAVMLTTAAHFVDDVVDQGLVPPARALEAGRMMLLEIPSNSFYRENFTYLQPLLGQCWLQWCASDRIEREPGGVVTEEDRAMCFVLRAGLYGLFHGMAVVAGGLDWAQEVGPEIYRAYGEKLREFDHA